MHSWLFLQSSHVSTLWHVCFGTGIHPQCDQYAILFDHMRDATAGVRNPALDRFKILTEQVHTPMDVRDQWSECCRDDARELRSFLRQL